MIDEIVVEESDTSKGDKEEVDSGEEEYSSEEEGEVRETASEEEVVSSEDKTPTSVEVEEDTPSKSPRIGVMGTMWRRWTLPLSRSCPSPKRRKLERPRIGRWYGLALEAAKKWPNKGRNLRSSVRAGGRRTRCPHESPRLEYSRAWPSPETKWLA